MNLEKLAEHLTRGTVNATRHATLPLTLYNYSRSCQYEAAWDEVSLQCRGLVIDDNGAIVARPLKKFFNDSEHKPEDIPWHLPCAITEKIDGSLLILFYYGNAWHVCTRGSFTSDQAKMGMDILWELPLSELDSANTYCFELIHPDNRIVVDYGDRTDAVLLAAIETASGVEETIEHLSGMFSVVRSLPANANPRELRKIITDDEEGYVVRFANGFRMKVKGERYMELHRLFSGITARMIWERLSSGTGLDDVMPLVDEETRGWIEAQSEELLMKVYQIEELTRTIVDQARLLSTRRDQALLIKEKCGELSGTAFMMLDNRNWKEAAWKAVYPEHRRPSRLSHALEGY